MRPIYDATQDYPVLITDYPYGRLRCQIRFWLESNNKGFRFCHQTQNPKTGQWNNPKHSTYAEVGGCVYEAENGHIECARLGIYSSHAEALEFVKNFPGADLSRLQRWVDGKIKFYTQLSSGQYRIAISVNGVVEPQTDGQKAEDLTKHQAELAGWTAVKTQLEHK